MNPLPIILLFWMQSAPAVARQDLRLVYGSPELDAERGDALASSIREFGKYGKTKPREPAKVLPDAEHATIEREILPAARKHCQDSSIFPKDFLADTSSCAHDSIHGFRVIGVAEGSFTKPHASQKAILYQYCVTAHNFALDGIAVLEKGDIAGHIVYAGSWESGIVALPAFDGGARSEILVATGGINCGELWGMISLLEVSANGVRKFGRAETYHDYCGALPETAERGATTYRWYVRTGAAPLFYREAFKRKCRKTPEAEATRGNWVKSEALKQTALESDGVEYVRLK